MIEIKSTILFMAFCICLLVQISNGDSSLRQSTAPAAASTQQPQQLQQERHEVSRFKVIKSLSINENESDQQQHISSSTNSETTTESSNSNSNSKHSSSSNNNVTSNNNNNTDMDAMADEHHEDGQQQGEEDHKDEDYVMDRPASENARLGESCSTTTRPCSGDFVKCRSGICSCEDSTTHIPSKEKPGNCEEVYVTNVPLRGLCNRTHRCSGYFTECREDTCSCLKGYTVSATERDLCRERVHIQMDTGPKTDPTMIGVIVGLALMSVTLCVVMRLFAKARFRENRTIFNTANPRLMNVSLKKVKKQMTNNKSQGAGGGIRRGSQDSVAMSDGGRMSGAVQMNDRQAYNSLNRPENTILSTSIDEEPTTLGFGFGNTTNGRTRLAGLPGVSREI